MELFNNPQSCAGLVTRFLDSPPPQQGEVGVNSSFVWETGLIKETQHQTSTQAQTQDFSIFRSSLLTVFRKECLVNEALN